MSPEVVLWVTERKQAAGGARGVVLPGRLSWVHPVLPFRPRLLLASAADAATADGSAPRTTPSEVPALAWPLELLRQWEVRGMRPQ